MRKTDSLKENFKGLKERLVNDKKALFTVFLGLFGMVLILISELPSFTSDKHLKDEAKADFSAEDIEKEVEALLSYVDGAGKVRVLITYENSDEHFYGTNTEDKSKNGENQRNEQYIITEKGGEEGGLLLKTVYPKIRGVAVVCQGGDNPQVKSEITALLSALFDIGANRIKVACATKE